MRLSIDAMGGDHAPSIVIEGMARALKEFPNVFFLLFGDEASLTPLLKKHDLFRFKDRFEVHNTDEVITADMKPTVAIRRSKNSSLRLAIEAVHKKDADAVISAGNTGAFMGLSKLILKTIPGIDRPAIAALIPALNGSHTLMLDLGANAEYAPSHLTQFALMAQIFSEDVLKRNNPSIGLLNIGAENPKGNIAIQTTAQVLRESSWIKNFQGFIEGDDLLVGKFDIIVTDGFTGNVALKTMEGTYRFMQSALKEHFSASLRTKLGYLISRPAFKGLKTAYDPRKYNGAVFLGLNSPAIKSHGGTDAEGFYYALRVAVNTVENNVNTHIVKGIAHLDTLNAAESRTLKSDDKL